MPTLVMQMGHVARTRGATGTAGEQDWARAVAAAVRAELARRDTPWTVRAIGADEAPHRYHGDAFVAVHADGSVNASAHGASYGYRNTHGRQLGADWAAAYEAHGWSRGFRSPNYTRALARYYGTARARDAGNTRAVILEGGFLTNREDRQAMTGPGGPERMAAAIVDAVTGTTSEEDDMPTPDEIADAVWRRPITPRGGGDQETAASLLRRADDVLTAGGLRLVVEESLGPVLDRLQAIEDRLGSDPTPEEA